MTVPDALREFALEPADNARLANLCGPLDENLRLLEARLDVEIRRRGDSFRVLGARAVSAEQTLRELFQLAEAEEVTPERVHLALREHESGRPTEGERADPGIRLPRGGVRARGHHQRQYLSNIHAHDLTFGIGPAGTGKTYLAVACAVESLQAQTIHRVVLVRPAVEAGERLGFLPGSLQEKVDPYLRPLYDALYDLLDPGKVDKMLESNVIEIAPLAFMRGRTLHDAFIIMDEAQNTTSEQMKMFLTRMGNQSKAVITGDLSQCDLPNPKRSGLLEALRVLDGVEGIRFCHFEDVDVVRHHLVQRIVRAYDAYDRAEQLPLAVDGVPLTIEVEEQPKRVLHPQ